MKKNKLALFFALCFFITWGIGALALLFKESIEKATGVASGPNHPLFYLAVYSPTISAFIVIALNYGKKGFLAVFERYLNFKGIMKPMVIIGLGYLLFGLALRFIFQAIGREVGILNFSILTFVPYAAYWLIADAGPIGEEAGWRGFALPILQERLHPIIASLVLGFIWAIWHLPSFYLSSLVQSSMNLLVFIFQIMALTFFITAIYNISRGSIILAIWMHFLHNFIFGRFFKSGDSHILIIIACVYLLAGLFIMYKSGFKKETEIFPGSTGTETIAVND